MLTIRAQTLALQPESVAGHDEIECRIQIACDGKPLKDAAAQAALRDGSPWSVLAAKERTAKFKYSESLSGQYAFDGTEGPLECSVLARKKDAPAEEWVVGVALLGTPAALRERGNSWHDLNVLPPSERSAGGKAGAKKLGALIVKDTAALEELRKQVAEEEGLAAKAQAECDAAEAALVASAEKSAALRAQLGESHAAVRGGRSKEEIKAHKLKELSKQAENLEVQLGHVYQGIANVLDGVEDEEARFARLVHAMPAR